MPTAKGGFGGDSRILEGLGGYFRERTTSQWTRLGSVTVPGFSYAEEERL